MKAYHEVKKNMVFNEQTVDRPPRQIVILSVSAYIAVALVVSGRGKDKTLSLPLKRIVDPKQWALVTTGPR